MDARTTKDADLFSLDAATEDEAPPPAYGEIHNEQYGLKMAANVADDGRVDININQLNRRLSQIFTPSLRQTFQEDQDTNPPSIPYIPTSLSGEPGLPPPPPLNVVIQVVGSRGDVQPFIALGKVLKEKYGHRVRLATHPTFREFVQENGIEFFSIGGDPSRLMAFMVKNPSLVPGLRTLFSGEISQRRKDVSEYIQGCWRSCYRAGDGTPGSENTSAPFVADAIIANPPSFAHIHCAEKLGVPLHIMFTMPYSPTQAFPHPLANIQSSNLDPRLTNYVSYAMIDVLVWQSLGDIFNRFRTKLLGLEPVGLMWAPGMLDRLKVPHTYCWSPALIPQPKDWGDHISISGSYLLHSSDYTPEPNLKAFLDAGPPPVYIGFGSIVLDNPRATTELMFEVSRQTGQRLLLFESPGGMSAVESDSVVPVPDTVFMLGDAPHDWLFQHVSCVVHHGGAGTTMTGIAAGKPTVIVPFFGDQAFWGAMIARVGAGPAPIPQKNVTVEKLTEAIDFCLKPETLERAKELASRTAAERGSETGAHLFHEHLTLDRLRCTLAPSRAAVWRIKRTKVKLSAFAVCTLTNANLLDPADLKLFRAQEYETDRGPYDPISGAVVAACEVASEITLGLKDMPSEAYKACALPFSKDSRPQAPQQPQDPKPTSASESEPSETTDHESHLPTSSKQQDQTTLDVRDYQPRVRRHTDASSSNSLASDIALMSVSDAPPSTSSTGGDQDQKPENPARSQPHFDFSSGADRDMMSQPGVHTHKGLGRFTKAVIQSPMDMTISFTKGFHNLPKAWGDDTVRPQPQINSFMSGAKSAGKEFGLGMYDGITGIVTQPWKGARKEGIGGFAKGFGKGIGGLVAKPSAAAFGIVGYTMKGIHKECQKISGSSVQTYIMASRLAQGEEEWRLSSDEEKEEVIAGWKVLQKYLKKKHSPEEMVRDVLEGQRKARKAASIGHSRSVSGSTVDSARLSMGPDRGIVVMNGWHPPVEEQVVEVAELESTESPRHDGGVEWDRVLRLDDEQDKVFDKAMKKESRGSSSAGMSSSLRHRDSGHLAGTSRSAFEARQDKRQESKSQQEKTEEEIVLEYIKKQSLMEEQLRRKGESCRAGPSVNEDDEHDEDLRRALELSMQGLDRIHEMDG
jgi:UDP:flavonoid glycosyltransferase YjiC (YdhE family)